MEKKNTQAPERVRNSEIIQSDTGEEIEIYLNDVCCLLDEYQDKQNIDLHKETQSRWNGALLYIGKYFKHTKKLKEHPHEVTGEEEEKRGNSFKQVNNNSYDMDKIQQLCDLYICLCYEYDKEVSVMGFSKLSGIEREVLEGWGTDYRRQTPAGRHIVENLLAEREESLSNRLFSSKSNPVGVLGILNHWYGWNMGQPRGNTAQAPASIETIQAKYINTPAPEKIPPLVGNTPPTKNIPPYIENTPPIPETPPAPTKNTPAPAETPPPRKTPGGKE